MNKHLLQLRWAIVGAVLLVVGCAPPFSVPPPRDSTGIAEYAADEILIKVAAAQDLTAIDAQIPGRRIDVLSFGGHAYLRYRLEAGEDVEELISRLTAKPGIETAEKRRSNRERRAVVRPVRLRRRTSRVARGCAGC